MHFKKTQVGLVVDRLFKISHFIPCSKTVNSSHVALILAIDCLYGLLGFIFCDIDIRFTCHFWRTLWKKMGIALQFSTTYQPQTHGQTEVVNQSLRDLL